MELSIEKILQFMERYGLPWLISAIVIWFVVTYFRRKLNDEALNRSKSVHQDFPFDYDIQRHSILSTLEIFYTTTVHTICFINPFKQLLWTDFLVAYYRAMHDFVKEGLDREYHLLPKSKFHGEVTSWILELPGYCEKRVSEEMSPYFESAESLNMILPKFRALSRYNHAVFFQLLSELYDTPALVNNKQRLAGILYAWKAFNMLSMTTIDKVLNEMNGDLNGLVYKGVKNESPQKAK